MLKFLDVLAGFAAIMLLASVAVTVLTQLAVGIVNSRGRELRNGLVTLFKQAFPDWNDHAREWAEAVLRHPLIATRYGRLGSVIERAELVKILLELADRRNSPLRRAFQQHGLADPAATLRAIRREAARLEAEKPETAGHVRQTIAIFEHASNEAIHRLTDWFDSSMDRVSHTYQNRVRLWTAIFAAVLAAAAQLDAIALLNRLAADDPLRRALVTPPEHWPGEWSEHKLAGVMLSAVLMSLGAPFWHDLLKNLLRLRPLIAAKEEAERRERGSAQTDHS